VVQPPLSIRGGEVVKYRIWGGVKNKKELLAKGGHRKATSLERGGGEEEKGKKKKVKTELKKEGGS